MGGELFVLGESLSPRLQWMRDNAVRTHYASHRSIEMPWCAWTPDNDMDADVSTAAPEDPELCGYGKTEAASVEDLADKLGVVDWGQYPVGKRPVAP